MASRSLLAGLVLVGFLAYCSPSQPCTPGKTESCACVGGGSIGAQICKPDGSGWGGCQCPTGSEMQPEPTQEKNAEQGSADAGQEMPAEPTQERATEQSSAGEGDIEQANTDAGQEITHESIPPENTPLRGTPRITEVMASPPTGQVEYVEIQNTHNSESLNLCGLFLSDGTTPREIVAFPGNKCDPVGPGKYAILIEPDYDRRGNPYGIPADAVFLTTAGSTTTLLSGGLSSGEPIQLLHDKERLIEQVSPSVAPSGTWPSGKSLERCDPNGPNDRSNWAESLEKSGGTPGRPNTAKCR